MTTLQSPNADTDARRDAMAERIMDSATKAMETFSMTLGHRLGYYRTLADNDGLTSVDLAEKTNTVERYAREWLEQQTVSGILEVEDSTLPERERRFSLPAGHDEVLADPDSLDYLAPLAQVAAGATHPFEQLLDAYRNGGGVSYHDYGADLLDGQAGMNRAAFLQLLGKEWIPSIRDLHRRLLNDPAARVADFGCGAAWSSIGMAQAYPKVHVDGFDLDAPSIELASKNVREAGLEDRVDIQLRDASDETLAGRYQLVTAFECLHDMNHPVEALQTMRRLCTEDGTVIIMDEKVGESFNPNAGAVERLFYGFSVLHCLPVGMTDTCSAGTGTVFRTETLRGYAEAAGFQKIEVLPIDNLFFRFYRLVP